MTKPGAIILGAVTAIFLAALGLQRCEMNERLAQQQAAVTKSDAQLVETVEELGAEKIEAAKTQAKAVRTKVAADAKAEVQREAGDSDIVGWLDDHIDRAGADADAGRSGR